MPQAKQPLLLSPDDYLEGEKSSEQRHEYIDGDVFAMAGGSDAHETISLNIASHFKSYLKGSECRTYVSGMKAQVDETQYFYPDVMVTCEASNDDNNYAKRLPKLIIEVLSPSTEAYDRGKKFAFYRQLDSLIEYVLVSQYAKNVEVFRKNNQQQWQLFLYDEHNPQIQLNSIEWSGHIHDFYDEVVFLVDETEGPVD